MQAPELPVLVVGEALTDILTDHLGGVRAHLGGSPANVALGVSRLGHPVLLATRLGTDDHGRLLRNRLTESGVVLTGGSVVDAPTSTATATVSAGGVASYDFDITWRLPHEATEPARTRPIAHLHTGSLAAALAPGAAQVLAAVDAARGRATVSYDPNLRPALLGSPADELPRVEALVEAADVVKASDEDLAWLHPGQDVEAVAARWSRSGPALVVLTLGAGGARAFWRHGHYDVAPTTVPVVDTVGAGDAFMAGLISGLLRAGLLGEVTGTPDRPPARAELVAATRGDRLGRKVIAALSLAARAAAITCTRPGADPPSLAELLD